jgi:hypothetical protein
MAWAGIWVTIWRFRWPLGNDVTLNAKRSVICGGAAHRVRLSQEGEGAVVTVAVAVAVTTTVTIAIEDGVARTVVVSKAVTTSVTKRVEVGGDMNEAEVEEGERKDEIRDGGEVTGAVLDGSSDWVSCEDESVGIESEVEARDRVEVMGAMLDGSLYRVNCEDKLVSVAFCVESSWLEFAGAARA